MQALIDTLRAIGIVLLLIVSRIVLLLVALVVLAFSVVTTVGTALGIGRLFHRGTGVPPGAQGEGARPSQARHHRMSIHR
jgi:hypothetical protein